MILGALLIHQRPAPAALGNREKKFDIRL